MSEALGPQQVAQYLDRIGVAGPVSRDLPTLSRLIRGHLEHIPFENLSVHGREPIALTVEALFDKLVVRRRGGFCYELGGAFAGLLTALGFAPRLLEARVYDPTGALGIRFDHLATEVELDRAYLVDVGFGDSPRSPLALAADGIQSDGLHEHWLERTDDDGEYQAWILNRREPIPADPVADPVWFRKYWLSRRPRALADFAPGCQFHLSAASPFAKGPVCSMYRGRTRTTLRRDRLIETSETGERRESVVTGPGHFRTLLRERFGIDNPPDWTLGPAN